MLLPLPIRNSLCRNWLSALFLSTSNVQAQQADARRLLGLGLVEALGDGVRLTDAGAEALVARRSKDELGGL